MSPLTAYDRFRDFIAKHVHVDGHDPENFRGCTHPDCVVARMYLVNYDNLVSAVERFMNNDEWALTLSTAPADINIAYDLRLALSRSMHDTRGVIE